MFHYFFFDFFHLPPLDLYLLAAAPQAYADGHTSYLDLAQALQEFHNSELVGTFFSSFYTN
jgi:hypothetical protein